MSTFSDNESVYIDVETLKEEDSELKNKEGEGGQSPSADLGEEITNTKEEQEGSLTSSTSSILQDKAARMDQNEEEEEKVVVLQNLVVTSTLQAVPVGAQVQRAPSPSVPAGLSNRQRVPGSNIRPTGSLLPAISPLGRSPAGVRGAPMGFYPF